MEQDQDLEYLESFATKTRGLATVRESKKRRRELPGGVARAAQAVAKLGGLPRPGQKNSAWGLFGASSWGSATAPWCEGSGA